MASYHHLDDLRSLSTKINEKAHNLFKEKPGKAPLQVCRILPRKPSKNGEQGANRWVPNLDVCDKDQMTQLQKEEDDCSQIYTIRQDRSWTTLNISRKAFESFMEVHNIMPNFWKCIFTFGRKSVENEFEFPGFGRRRSGFKDPLDSTYEFAYMIRRVELNGRDVTEGESPWSIRQTAVYQKLCHSGAANKPKSTFLLVAPSENVEWQFASCLEQKIGLSSWNVHRILIADSLRGWRDYMTSLEKRLKEQTDPIVLATVGSNKGNFSPLTDFTINFEDRQELKIIEDQILDLQIILPSMLDAISGVQEQCQALRDINPSDEEEKYEMDAILGEFDEYVREAQMHIRRAKTLKQQSLSTSQLLSDLLSYEEAVALKDLARETQIESRSMCHLTEKSVKDAAAVKILTIITLIYLPTTIVANFFSTQFVHTSDSGSVGVAGNAWLLAAISIPLTFFTIVLWWAWVHFTKVAPTVDPEHPGVVTLKRQNTLKSMVSSDKKKRSKKADLEMGLSAPQTPSSTFYFPFRHSPAPTWGTGSGSTDLKEK